MPVERRETFIEMPDGTKVTAMLDHGELMAMLGRPARPTTTKRRRDDDDDDDDDDDANKKKKKKGAPGAPGTASAPSEGKSAGAKARRRRRAKAAAAGEDENEETGDAPTTTELPARPVTTKVARRPGAGPLDDDIKSEDVEIKSEDDGF